MAVTPGTQALRSLAAGNAGAMLGGLVQHGPVLDKKFGLPSPGRDLEPAPTARQHLIPACMSGRCHGAGET
jgi:hypothetical protein